MESDAKPKRIFVVEDEFLLGAMLEEDLRSAGHTVLGPFTNLSQAMLAAGHEQFDLAILDVNLRGEFVYPLAEELLRRRIPFVFLSGYRPANLPDKLRAVPCVSKPYDRATLVRELNRALGSS